MSEPGLPPVHPETGRRETEKQRIDRNLGEFLGELRVALPGVQVLFAFLLIVPFNSRFEQVTSFQETLYFGTLLCAASSSVFLIAPTVHHRIEFRRARKERMLFTSNRLAIAGLAFLAAAIAGSLLLITDLLYGTAMTAIVGAGVLVALGGVWFVVPLRRIARGERRID